MLEDLLQGRGGGGSGERLRGASLLQRFPRHAGDGGKYGPQLEGDGERARAHGADHVLHATGQPVHVRHRARVHGASQRVSGAVGLVDERRDLGGLAAVIERRFQQRELRTRLLLGILSQAFEGELLVGPFVAHARNCTLDQTKVNGSPTDGQASPARRLN